jgi:hypothetical protein
MCALFPIFFICELEPSASRGGFHALHYKTHQLLRYVASRALLSQPRAMVSKDARIIVVGGAGTMGSSTALHLTRRGYTDVRVLDMFQPPSANSAGNDMNKVCMVAYKAWNVELTDPAY